MKPFIVTSLQQWELELGTTVRSFSLEIAKHHPLLYVNTPLDWASWMKGMLKPTLRDRRFDLKRDKKASLRQVQEKLWILDCPFKVLSINFIRSKRLFDLLNKWNNARIARHIRWATNELHFEHPTLFIDNDIFRSFYLKDLLKPAISIYYRRDYVIGRPYWKRHGVRLEPLLASKSDLSMANSVQFKQEIGQYNPKTYLLETGVNIHQYNPSLIMEIPKDIQHIRKPIVGYTGYLTNMRLDRDLLEALVERMSDVEWVFTGPEDEDFKHSRLHKMPNTHFTGNKKVEELPLYVAQFDVCINPQRINEITDGNYPLKIDEYLAMGKPVVATATQIMMETFAAHTHLANDVDSYEKMIRLALSESENKSLKKDRIAFANSHSWENRTQTLFSYIEDYQKKR